MTTESKRETWEDWQGFPVENYDGLIGRAELIERAREQGVDVTENNILYWQKVGVLPYPVLRRVHRRSYAVYPLWMVDTLKDLRHLQKGGWALRDITQILREVVPVTAEVYRDFAARPRRCPCCGQVITKDDAND